MTYGSDDVAKLSDYQTYLKNLGNKTEQNLAAAVRMRSNDMTDPNHAQRTSEMFCMQNLELNLQKEEFDIDQHIVRVVVVGGVSCMT